MDTRGLTRRQVVAAAIVLLAGLVAILLPHRNIFGQMTQIVYLPLDFVVFALAIAAAVALAVLLAPAEREAPAERVGLLGSLLVASAVAIVGGAIACILLAPELLAPMVREDGPAEILQAAVLFSGAAFAFAAAAGWKRRWPSLFSAALGAGMLLIGLEEVSWFQRIIGFETPEFLAGNLQDESNLHNLATGASEAIYYIGAIVLMVLSRLALLVRIDWVRALVPSLPIMAVGLLTAGLNYEMWPRALVVFGFALSVAVGVTIIRTALQQQRRAAWLGGIVALTVAAQLVLVTAGHRMLFAWDIDEVRETLIAGGLFGYACLLWSRARSHKVKLSAAPALTG